MKYFLLILLFACAKPSLWTYQGTLPGATKAPLFYLNDVAGIAWIKNPPKDWAVGDTIEKRSGKYFNLSLAKRK